MDFKKKVISLYRSYWFKIFPESLIMNKFPVLCIGLLLFTTSLFAQSPVVNVQSLLREPQKEGVSIHAGGTTKRYGGNADYYSLEPFFLAYYVFPQEHMLFSKTAFSQAVNEDDAFIAAFFQHVRGRYKVKKELLYAESYVQYDFAESRRIENRVVTGFGPRFVLFSSKKENITKYTMEKNYTSTYRRGELIEQEQLELPAKKEKIEKVLAQRFYFAYGSSYLYEFIEYSRDEEYSDSGAREYHHRWSNYFDMIIMPWSKFALEATIYYQPRFDEFNDYYILSENSLLIKYSSYISLNLTGTVAYISQPAQGIEPMSYSFGGGVNFTFLNI